MQVIDSHVHFWDLGLGNQPWLLNPQPNLLGDYSPMACDYGPDALRSESRMSVAGQAIELVGAVHIEADAVDPIKETRWLAGLDDPLPSALVVGVDLSQADAVEQLETQLTLSDRVRGIRQILNVHANPLFDYVGRHYMSESTWRDNFRHLARLGLSFDLQIYPSQMAQAAELADANPEVQFLLNHAGMYVDRQGVAGWRAWRDGMRELAARDNVATKLSGFGMLDHQWTAGSIRPLILEAIDAFGVERCLFASNFPVDSLYASYDDTWRAYAEIVAEASATEKQALFVDNAQRLYRLSLATPTS
ncbi:amidohydrolase family protein [Halomonas huangheensis]|uniref:Amidohydrolase-related domain-containing protein n=1 Tax=Halomonas huangheensis TaxID=1178482 RepID=W1N7H8_9GAMM|nr:amidohydrolase family protein [Halomonas huangheensis]ALM54296.1 amidohydrolase [Halomonas huangheensis]ERL50850.1 hypothetical protein BJB45_19835 [Halomonas huangheensis]